MHGDFVDEVIAKRDKLNEKTLEFNDNLLRILAIGIKDLKFLKNESQQIKNDLSYVCNVFGEDQVFVDKAEVRGQKVLVVNELSKVIPLEQHSKDLKVIVEVFLSALLTLRGIGTLFEEAQEIFNGKIHHDVVLRLQLNLM